MTQTELVLALVAVGIVLGAVLLAWAARARAGTAGATDDGIGRATAAGISVGMLFGAALSVVVWISTGQFVFWVIFLCGGMTVGMALGRAMAGRSG
jgi:hypothetical protein